MKIPSKHMSLLFFFRSISLIYLLLCFPLSNRLRRVNLYIMGTFIMMIYFSRNTFSFCRILLYSTIHFRYVIIVLCHIVSGMLIIFIIDEMTIDRIINISFTISYILRCFMFYVSFNRSSLYKLIILLLIDSIFMAMLIHSINIPSAMRTISKLSITHFRSFHCRSDFYTWIL